MRSRTWQWLPCVGVLLVGALASADSGVDHDAFTRIQKLDKLHPPVPDAVAA